MFFFAGILLIPITVAACFFLFTDKTITKEEFGAHVAAQTFVAMLTCMIIYGTNTGDVEIINGQVVGKKKVKVSCEHSYVCNCRTQCSRFGKERSCHEVCDTCYEHWHDWDWVVYTNAGSWSFRINRIDRQGNHEPPRWTKVQPGQPVARTHYYRNYIKGAKDTLFLAHGDVEKFKKFLPVYPSHIYDYHHINRIVQVKKSTFNAREVTAWNGMLEVLNSKLGPTKYANVVLVFAQDTDRAFYLALKQHWLGGKKNDLVVVIGVKGKTIEWADIMSWSKTDLVNVKIRDRLLDLKTIEDPEKIFSALREEISKHYKRKPMKDFEYLASSITPTGWQWFWSGLFGIVVSIGLGIFLHKNEIRERHF